MRRSATILTPDLAEVQVAKGSVSVLNGPGGEGGAINLVSRKPTKEIELEGRTGLVTDGDLSSLNSWNAYAYAGTRQKGYYAQVSGNIVDQDHFNLSHDFTPANSSTLGHNHGVAAGFPYQRSGERDRSDFRDWRINAKVGLTPNATYTNQFTGSPYDDYSYGGFVEMGTDLIPMNTLKGAIHFRRDFHNEQSINYKYVPTYTVTLDPANGSRKRHGRSLSKTRSTQRARSIS